MEQFGNFERSNGVLTLKSEDLRKLSGNTERERTSTVDLMESNPLCLQIRT
jgi:hypothetical protein